MSTSTYTLLDVVQIVGFRSGNFKSNPETVENPDLAMKNMIECINSALRRIAMYKGLPMLNKRTTITTVPVYKTGTIAVTSGSATVTGTSTVWDATMVGRAISGNDTNAMYRVTAVNSATELVLDRSWEGTTNAAMGYAMAQDRYELPSDFSDFVSVSLEGKRTRTLEIVPSSKIAYQRHTMRMRVLDVGAPTMVSVYDRSPGDLRMLELDLFPEDTFSIAIQYEATAPRLRHDNERIPVFDKNVDILYSGALAMWRSTTGASPEDKAAWEMWIQTELPRYMAIEKEKTDEAFMPTPEDTTRQGRQRQSIYDIAASNL